jgi:hypothetical protein
MSLRRAIESLGPYPSLFLLGVPTAMVEPLKLAALAIAGKGHWITGTAIIVACYAFSLLVLERLFLIVKPKLLTISWFAKLWKWFVSIRTRAWAILKASIGYHYNREQAAPVADSLRRPPS